MEYFWVYVLSALVVLAAVALGTVGFRLNQSSKRVARSYAPIGVKVKALGIEVSALKRSRLARERRLEGSSSNEIDSEE
jgi:hypothetical protein